MPRKKVLIAITNRSSYNKVKTVIQNLLGRVEVELLLGGSLYLYQYGSVGKIIEDDFPDIRKWKTSLLVEGDCLAKMPKSVGTGLLEISTILENSTPNLVISVADRFETMATAVAASYTNIPLAHIQGGEISGTIDDKVRNAITQLSDYHFPATCDAADRIANMKMRDMERIWAHGCPSMDLMSYPASLKDCATYLNLHGVGDEFVVKPYIIVMMHPDTTGEPVNEEHMAVLCEALNNYGCQKVIFWNNIDPGGGVISKTWRMTREGFWKDRVRYIRHVPPNVFAGLMKNARMIVGNSSAGIREASFIPTPSVSVGTRQAGREHGDSVVFCTFSYSDIMYNMNLMERNAYLKNDIYGDGHAGEKIANQIEEIVYGRLG